MPGLPPRGRFRRHASAATRRAGVLRCVAPALTPRAQCGAARGGGDLYFCGACHVILPPDGAHDHFALLSAPRAFDLPPPALEAAYKAAAKALHPDKFSTRPEARSRRSSAVTVPPRGASSD